MNAVIPHACAEPAPHSGTGALRAAGPWRVTAAVPALEPVADTVRALLSPHLPGRLPPAGDDVPGARTLHLALDDAPPPPPRATAGVAPDGGERPADESHRLRITADGISCLARTPEGVFRAATTAVQLLATAPEDGELPYQELTDAPRHAWRGLMVDPARSFLTPDELRRIIDLAALYKLNVLHLHLTDNEGWRLGLPGVPGLTETGADGAPPAFYTAADYRALQEYAARRFVTVVPEIDLPGHCRTLRQALPGLAEAPAPDGLRDRFPFVPPLDLTDAATRGTVARILTEVCALTTGPYIHIGGDEAFGATEESFAASVRELLAIVRESGKRPVGWQESSRAGLGPGDIAQHWVDVPMMDLPDTPEELAARPELVAAGRTMEINRALKTFFAPTDDDVTRIVEAGARVLLSPQSHLYLDRPYATRFAPSDRAEATARLGFGGYRPLGVQHTASWDPSAYGLPDECVAGVEATVFAEQFKGFDDVSVLLLPRLASVAEAAWCGHAPRWPEYRERLAHHARLWTARALPYFPTTEVPWR
ncbi:family 20 glycosylhydrolase [Streptomyces sp. ITFR-16]|uniref:family 20 glycosylhydrolase n=1 Tax=Streptomyces sp. ITFR-16 TaxID=3075198 RepID=UPI00288BBB75|nr:family 20 glycosylhydrolase [Streptomyces sp. ITFR-16]WNI21537.1 family 20 glycosylhydrolase [Streptomyces sp. ITFR-16]